VGGCGTRGRRSCPPALRYPPLFTLCPTLRFARFHRVLQQHRFIAWLRALFMCSCHAPRVGWFTGLKENGGGMVVESFCGPLDADAGCAACATACGVAGWDGLFLPALRCASPIAYIRDSCLTYSICSLPARQPTNTPFGCATQRNKPAACGSQSCFGVCGALVSRRILWRRDVALPPCRCHAAAVPPQLPCAWDVGQDFFAFCCPPMPFCLLPPTKRCCMCLHLFMPSSVVRFSVFVFCGRASLVATGSSLRTIPSEGERRACGRGEVLLVCASYA